MGAMQPPSGGRRPDQRQPGPGRDPRQAAGPGGPRGGGPRQPGAPAGPGAPQGPGGAMAPAGPGRSARPGGPGAPGGERTQALAADGPGMRRGPDGEGTQAMSVGGRRRAGGPGRRRMGPGGPGGPEGPGGPGGRGPRDPFDDDDDDKPRNWKRFIPNWKIVVAGFTILAAGVFGMIAVAYANTPVPQATQDEAVSQGSSIYYADGKTLIARVGTAREIVPLSDVPPHVQDAVISIENKTFWDDSGVSVPGMARSLWMTATGQQLQGASTITQQMARNYYDGLSQDVSIKRKLKEIFVAVKLNKEMDKDKILEQYLNTVPFGRAYGIQAAAKAYFKKTAKQLTPAEGAYLAARIQTPALDADSPQLQSRFKDVINAMAAYAPDKYGNLPATAKFPKAVKEYTNTDLSGSKGYMVNVVLRELAKRGIQEDKVKANGYKIVSTFDRKLMLAAKNAVLATTKGMDKDFHAGLASVDPKNGRVVAFYGGDDYEHDPWNEPFDSRKQAASAFKPYVLAAWLEAGYSLNSYVPGKATVPKVLPGTTKITNDEVVPASIDVTYATAHSINTAFASMAFKLPGQLEDVRSLVEQAGISTKAVKDDKEGVNGEHGHGYQLAIGSIGVTPVEQAAGYSIFANNGLHADYHVIKSVQQGKVTVLPELKSLRQVISPESAADATSAMEEVLKVGTAQGKGIGRPAAGKTGTNNDEKEAWFVGYTPQLVTSVGMYREQCRTKKGKVVQPEFSNCPPSDGKKNSKYSAVNPYSLPYEVSLGFQGANQPTDIWRDFMMAALQNKPVEQFPQKAGIGSPEDIVPSPPPPAPPKDQGQDCKPWDHSPQCQGQNGQQCQPGDNRPQCQGQGGQQCQPGDTRPQCQGQQVPIDPNQPNQPNNPNQPNQPNQPGTPVTTQAETIRRFTGR
ncbi:transglycosylase domain-containing protein [Planotetraspora phitsanulokensis]|nr:transglycosylase domain-containing protein [Planotetraspora phitsanulokensis]